eukprot:TRINITY_DN4935_c0_g1_i15.p1 TRINITY_DN4935_c0_g1~~TRINITY_DN4935_c0_g1_i15.p1  ORF type:complete len:337 (-),score=76.07 TRINITY_DN4935_c0_g1_i15:66-1076(-)
MARYIQEKLRSLKTLNPARLGRELRYLLRYSINRNVYSKEERAARLSAVTYEQLANFSHKIPASSQAKVMLVGVLNEDDVISTVGILNKTFKGEYRDSKAEIPDDPIINLKNLSIIYRDHNPVENSQNHLILNYYQIGPCNQTNDAAWMLLENAFDAELFNVLRTEKQLGYTVKGMRHKEGKMDGFIIQVTGSKLNPIGMDKEIEEYIKEFYHIQEKKDPQELESQKEVVKGMLEAPDSSLEELLHRYWNLVEEIEPNEEIKDISTLIDEITNEDLLRVYNQTFATGRLSLQWFSRYSNETLRLELPSANETYGQFTSTLVPDVTTIRGFEYIIPE